MDRQPKLESGLKHNDTIEHIEHAFPEKISNIAKEIARLMREGPEERKKAQELMRKALNDDRDPARR